MHKCISTKCITAKVPKCKVRLSFNSPRLSSNSLQPHRDPTAIQSPKCTKSKVHKVQSAYYPLRPHPDPLRLSFNSPRLSSNSLQPYWDPTAIQSPNAQNPKRTKSKVHITTKCYKNLRFQKIIWCIFLHWYLGSE